MTDRHDGGPAWKSMDTAPKGEWVERQTGKGVAQVHVPKRIIALMSDGDWTVSYWIEKAQRWNMFKKDSPPLAWCLPPCATAMLAARSEAK